MTAECVVEPFLAWREPEPATRGSPALAFNKLFRPVSSSSVSGMVSDAELMRLYRGGDHDAFRQLYERYRRPLMRFIWRMALDRSVVEEIAQETWMAVISGRERYVPHTRFVAYIFSIARRRGMDRWRWRRRHPESEDIEALDLIPAPESSQPESLIAEEAVARAIVAALEALPLPQRETFLLRAETDLTIDEIAQVTGTTRETAKSRLRYGMRRLE